MHFTAGRPKSSDKYGGDYMESIKPSGAIMAFRGLILEVKVGVERMSFPWSGRCNKVVDRYGCKICRGSMYGQVWERGSGWYVSFAANQSSERPLWEMGHFKWTPVYNICSLLPALSIGYKVESCLCTEWKDSIKYVDIDQREFASLGFQLGFWIGSGETSVANWKKAQLSIFWKKTGTVVSFSEKH